MKEIYIIVVGLGTVGSNVIKSIENKSYEIIHKTNIKFNIVGVSANNKDKKRIIDTSKYQWIDNPLDFLGSNRCDVLIELIGEEKGLSYELIKKAITNNINVITANKALLAKHGNETPDGKLATLCPTSRSSQSRNNQEDPSCPRTRGR